jgi:HemY protein
VRILFWFLIVAAAAVGVALAAKLTAGYALFVSPPYRVELSLNLFLFLAVAGFVLGYVLIRGVARALRLPDEVREFRRRQQQERAQSKHNSAVVALLEGRYGKARQFAEEALAVPQSSGLSALVAARAAIETRDFNAAEKLLLRPDARVASLAVPRLMFEAEMKLEQGQPLQALTQLRSLKKEAGSHTAALRLELRALQAAGRYAEIPAVVDQLVKRKVYRAEEADLIRAAAHAQQLAALSNDPSGLRSYWSRFSDAEARNPRIARAGARGFLVRGGDREAADIITRSLERTWDPDLLALYPECHTPDATWQLEQAERWLTEHNQDAGLLYVLGVLCDRQQLWGKAQTYLEASLALDNAYRTHVALGELHARLGHAEEANAHLAAALKLALAELARVEADRAGAGRRP